MVEKLVCDFSANGELGRETDHTLCSYSSVPVIKMWRQRLRKWRTSSTMYT